MIKRDTHKQEISSVVWVIEIPEGATKGRPLAAYNESGNSIQIDSWSLENQILTVNFGIDPVSGELLYEYQIEGEDRQDLVVNGNGGSIHVTINQHNCGKESQPLS